MRGLIIHYTDPAPFVFCEFCKSMQAHGNAPQVPQKQVHRNSEVRRSGVRCATGRCIKPVKSVFRTRARHAGAMRGCLSLISRAIVHAWNVHATVLAAMPLTSSLSLPAPRVVWPCVCVIACVIDVERRCIHVPVPVRLGAQGAIHHRAPTRPMKSAAKVGKPMTMDPRAVAADAKNNRQIRYLWAQYWYFCRISANFHFYEKNCIRPKRA